MVKIWVKLKGVGIDPKAEMDKFAENNDEKKTTDKNSQTPLTSEKNKRTIKLATIVDERSPKLKEALAKKETQIKDGKFEKGVVFDKDGNIVGEFFGSKSEVHIPSRLIKGNIIMHTPPQYCT